MKKALASLVLAAATAAQTPEMDIEDAKGNVIGDGYQQELISAFRWDATTTPSSQAVCVLLLGGAPNGPFIRTDVLLGLRAAPSVSTAAGWYWDFSTNGASYLAVGRTFWIQPVWLDGSQVGWDQPALVRVVR